MKPNVIVSMTTTPYRIKHIEAALQSIFAQTKQADRIYVNVPSIFEREGTPYTIPESLLRIPKVVVNHCEHDYGPATKLLGVLNIEEDPETMVVTIDDDIYYPDNLLETYVKLGQSNPDAVFSPTGFNIQLHRPPGQLIQLNNEHLGRISIVEGFGSIAYRRKFFDDSIYAIKDYPTNCYLSDDLVISNYLEKKRISKLYVRSRKLNRGHLKLLDIGQNSDALHNGANGLCEDNESRYRDAAAYLDGISELYL